MRIYSLTMTTSLYCNTPGERVLDASDETFLDGNNGGLSGLADSLISLSIKLATSSAIICCDKVVRNSSLGYLRRFPSRFKHILLLRPSVIAFIGPYTSVYTTFWVGCGRN